MSRVSELGAHTGYWLRLVSNSVSGGFAKKVAAEGVTVAEWVVLRQLYDVRPVPPSRLASDLGLTRGTVSKLADRLVDKRFVARRDDRDDARSHTLSLTAAGRALVPRLAALADANDAEFFGTLEPRDRKELERILRIIVERSGIDGAAMD